jgi:hypothetical protein
MRLRARLQRLERATRAGDCGPDCPPRAVALYCQDGRDGEPVREEGQVPPAPCPRCGRLARVVEMVVVYDPDFYGNTDRLATMESGT